MSLNHRKATEWTLSLNNDVVAMLKIQIHIKCAWRMALERHHRRRGPCPSRMSTNAVLTHIAIILMVDSGRAINLTKCF